MDVIIISGMFISGMNVSRICADDPASNCSHLSEVLNICSDIPHAKTVCRKFCGLCALGMYVHLKNN